MILSYKTKLQDINDNLLNKRYWLVSGPNRLNILYLFLKNLFLATIIYTFFIMKLLKFEVREDKNYFIKVYFIKQ